MRKNRGEGVKSKDGGGGLFQSCLPESNREEWSDRKRLLGVRGRAARREGGET